MHLCICGRQALVLTRVYLVFIYMLTRFPVIYPRANTAAGDEEQRETRNTDLDCLIVLVFLLQQSRERSSQGSLFVTLSACAHLVECIVKVLHIGRNNTTSAIIKSLEYF